MRRGFFKHTHPLAHLAKILASPRDMRFAFDQHQDDLAVTRHFGCTLARLQPIKAKAHIGPARRLGGDVMHLAMSASWFSQQM